MAIKLSNRCRLIKPSPTLSLSARAKEMKDAGIDVINFGVGNQISTLRTTSKTLHTKRLMQISPLYCQRWNHGIAQAICEKLKRDNALDYSPKDILVSPGAKASILNILIAVCDSQDQVLMASPYWGQLSISSSSGKC